MSSGEVCFPGSTDTGYWVLGTVLGTDEGRKVPGTMTGVRIAMNKRECQRPNGASFPFDFGKLMGLCGCVMGYTGLEVYSVGLLFCIHTSDPGNCCWRADWKNKVKDITVFILNIA